MSARVVIGLGYGDCGKGVVTEYLCSQSPWDTTVVRFNGGHQCGHKVIKGDREHIFSNFGAGTLSGCPTYWSSYCPFEPVGFCFEHLKLTKQGVNPKIIVHPDCPVVTPYDVYAGRNAEEVKHGTTGTGFYRTKKRHLQDKVCFTVRELIHTSWHSIVSKLEKVREYYGSEELDAELFYSAHDTLWELADKGRLTVSEFIPRKFGDSLVFEGGQGLMLDEHIGVMPHCSPSDLTPRNAMALSNIDEIFLVSRVYQTRHGNGPMTNAERTVELFNTEHETNVNNKWQGEFRKSVLDLDQLIWAKIKGIDEVAYNIPVSLVMTCADQMKEFPVSYNGQVFIFPEAKDLIYFVGNALEINNLYMNDSPRSDTLRRI